MGRYSFSLEARIAFDDQIDYLISRHALAAATALNARVHAFIRDTLCHHPGIGRHLTERGLWETWIPRTRIVVWYTFTEDELVIIALWHTAQDRKNT